MIRIRVLSLRVPLGFVCNTISWLIYSLRLSLSIVPPLSHLSRFDRSEDPNLDLYTSTRRPLSFFTFSRPCLCKTLLSLEDLR